MEIKVAKNDEQILITMIGSLDTLAAEQIDSQIKDVEADMTKPIVIDCTQLQYIASAGLRILLRIRKAASAHGQTVTLLCVSDSIKEILHITNFDKMFIMK